LAVSVIVPSCVARAGRALRLVIGADRLPELPFAAPDSPAWASDGTIELTRLGDDFTLHHAGQAWLSGAASVTPFRLEIDVGTASIHGFGA
jgi:hypothetical protein